MKSVLGRAKRSVDNTFNAFLGRAAFAACLIGAIVLILRGVWLFAVENYGTLAACFSVSALLACVGLVIRSVVVANEKAAKEEAAARARMEAEKNKSPESALPFDISQVMSVLPIVMPILRSSKSATPLTALANVLGGYVLSSSKTQTPDSSVSTPGSHV